MKTLVSIIGIVISVLLVTSAFAQVTRLNNQSTTNPEYLGWDGNVLLTHKDVDIINYYGDKKINFKIGSVPTQYAIIDDIGNVGIGTSFTAPICKFHVQNNHSGTAVDAVADFNAAYASFPSVSPVFLYLHPLKKCI